MLVIKDGRGQQRTWHVNEAVPDIEGPVVTFQADGHELDLFRVAMDMNYRYDGSLVPFKEGE